MSDITALVVDDEPAARRGLRKLLDAEPDVTVVGEARHGAEAVALIHELRPAVVFLDIQMPEMDGFEVLEALAGGYVPVIVFVTAYDQWAVKAFEAQALDYILKPYEDRRLRAVVQRVRTQLRTRPDELLQKVRDMMAARPGEPRFLTRLVLREGGVVQFVNLADVSWLEAADYYVRIHIGKETQLVRYTLNELERQLDPQRFMRVHRSAIVNAAFIQEIRVSHQSHHQLLLITGELVPLSRSRRSEVEQIVSRV